MSVSEETAVAAVVPAPDLVANAARLVDGLVLWPWGQVSPSVYETARVASLTPWLSGHAERIAFLVRTQRADGAWGAPDDGYALVPTLSATEALLRELRRERPAGATPAVLADAVARALHVLFTRLCGPDGARRELPDMPAVELIAPSLAERIDGHLAALGHGPDGGMGDFAGRTLTLPAGLSGRKLALVRAVIGAGGDLPPKLLHALEIIGDLAVALPVVSPEPTGTIGAAPAATAAWLGPEPPRDAGSPARWYLETVSHQHGGPVPVGFPLTVFERGWVLAWLLRAGVPVTVPPELTLSLTAPLGAAGTPAADGLPADADTTSGALYALALLGAPRPPDPLFIYELDTRFCTWQGEEGASLTTNAHVLEAFGAYVASVRPADDARYRAAMAKAAAWLRGCQREDGSWTDRWHASPYYATACCAIALAKFGGAGSAEAVAAARRWVLATQRPDGSWGRWEGTAEETAYAVQLLLLTGAGNAAQVADAVARARPVLRAELAVVPAGPDLGPALWHDKDLYRPTAIVRAAVVAALWLGDGFPDVN
ncbi:prenyltransferase/squalene oxidase repeat-containing protein [Actinomadura flavalba]|uniref:prenyltransferase/squalene oxidase repeat-containing protein n=1 Tax=Actinomadura flavalba TaxID=1120938 RepID=UPI000381B5E7|nr:prenyltransferase/squalene oxidase repeat-containing protein [Actinomadura flavalba]